MNQIVQPSLLDEAMEEISAPLKNICGLPEKEEGGIDYAHVGAGPFRKPVEPEPDFWKESADAIIFETQPRTACFVNKNNCVAIRQEATGVDGEDQYVFFTPGNVDHLIRMLGHVRDEAYEMIRESEG